MAFIAIVLMCVASAVAYGIVHDQVTARVCVEYFTVFHPPVIASDSPTQLALVWGVIATWWVGMFLGIGLGIAARWGNRPRLSARELWPAVGRLMLAVGSLALLAGLCGYGLGRAGWIAPSPWVARLLPKGMESPFLADLWAHNMSYVGGFIGGFILCVRTWRWRIARENRGGAVVDPAE